MSKDGAIGRRDFLRSTAAAAAVFSIVPAHVLAARAKKKKAAAAEPAPGPGAKLNIAGIGIGGMGATNLAALADTENIVALCDVDPLNYAAKTIAKYPKAKVYTDYREMLEKQKNIDAVIIATPDHTHAVITMAAMKAGKHVYCQKPLTHNVADARAIAEAARKCGVVTQMGIQGHSGDGIRLLQEWIQGGIIGQVKEADAWCQDSYYPWGHAGWSAACGPDKPKDTPPVPKGMNWDLWIGPAQMRPYHPAYHPMAWRSRIEFGNGWMGDRGVHTLDPVMTTLKLGAPLSVDATSLGQTEESHCVSAVITFMFAGRDDMPPCKVTWYDGLRPPRPADLEDDRSLDKTGGIVFKGTKGTIVCGVYGESPRIIPEKKMKALRDSLPKPIYPRLEKGLTGGHELDWVRAIRENRMAGADFSYSGPLTEMCLLGNVAKRVDQRIEWDPIAMKITNLEKANKYLKEEYREGWSL